MGDLITTTFFALRDHFFDSSCSPIPFRLRDKRNTQDDPFDDYLATQVLARLPDITCAKASGPSSPPIWFCSGRIAVKRQRRTS